MGERCPPKFTQKPALKQAGSSIVFSCELEASPEPSITWFKGSEKLIDNDRIQTSLTSKGERGFGLQLVLKNVSAADSGTYKVEAKNELGQMSANMNLNLQGTRYCFNLYEYVRASFTCACLYYIFDQSSVFSYENSCTCTVHVSAFDKHVK